MIAVPGAATCARGLAYLLWLGATLALAAAVVAERLLEPACELGVGSSIFGEASYTLLGQTCTYTLGGETFVLRPPPARAVLPVLLVAWLLSLLLLDRRAARAGGAGRRVTPRGRDGQHRR